MSDVAKIEKQIEKLKNKKQMILRQESAKQRKLDTRVKIILGGAALAHVKKDEAKGNQLIRFLQTAMTDKDKAVVDLWLDNAQK